MNIDAAIPPPPKHIGTETPTGYDIPRDTISKEFLKSARTARQSVESNASSIGTNFNDYLIPSTSTKLVPESPRIVITRPDDDPLPSPLSLKLDAEMLSRLEHKRDGTAPPRPTDRSFLLAVVLAVIVVVIVFLIIYLFFQLE
ncbi:hypothetical protein OESDEN_17795 [Oesophagostomum dentatum]|uniref:Uncharacterized protein n=1 Tax=Oesophagostomum dentatum TaxID=61180 RepID=A0A0B1SF45_OESDE|nr:hypothetical protein OESDEN_17795 [Oesophagostomum dentatum]